MPERELKKGGRRKRLIKVGHIFPIFKYDLNPTKTENRFHFNFCLLYSLTEQLVFKLKYIGWGGEMSEVFHKTLMQDQMRFLALNIKYRCNSLMFVYTHTL